MSGLYRQLARVTAAALLSIVVFAVPANAEPVTSDPVAADGAVGVNAQWEQGTSSAWWIEEQRVGVDYIAAGIADESSTQIQQGITIFNWGFAHQAADGTFPGSADNDTGAEFQSVSLFAEAVSRATLMLQQYRPVTYSLPSNYYAATIAAYTAEVHSAALWLMEPAIATAGQAGNLPYTHRRWLLAAALGETGKLFGDSTMQAAALPYAINGLSLQLGAGWQAAITQGSTGAIPPATLLAPGQTAPANTIRTVSAVGVNPELNGYDVNYQCLGIFYAEVYINYCTDPALAPAINTMIDAGLTWEEQFLNAQGAVDLTGSSRVGIEINHDGDLKTPAYQTIYQSYERAEDLDARFGVFYVRVSRHGASISSTPVAADGACNGNIGWEAGTATTWNIGWQDTLSDYIQEGIAREDPSLIQTGLTIMAWGFAHQTANGSFGTTQSAYYGACQFTEAAARCLLMLQHYQPLTYTQAVGTYQPSITMYAPMTHSAALWLTLPATVTMGQASIGASTDRYYATAAALIQSGVLCSDTALQTVGWTYVTAALPLQQSSGLNPDSGTYSVNYQAIGILYACYCAAHCTNPTLLNSLDNMISTGLVWETQWIGPNGTISGTTAPASLSICRAYIAGFSISDDPLFQVMVNRIYVF